MNSHPTSRPTVPQPPDTDAVAGGRILHVATRYLRGGSERRIHDAMRALTGFTHQLIVGPESDLALAQKQLPMAEISVEPALVRQPHPYHDAVALARLVRTIKTRQPVVVFTHQSKAGAIGRLAGRLAGSTPVVHSLSMASFGPGYSRAQSMVYQWLEARLDSATVAYAAVGDDLANRYIEAGIPADKFHVIRSGVPLPSVEGSRSAVKERLAEQLGIPPNRRWLVHVGSLDARKNVLVLPQLLSEMATKSGTTPHLILAGEGPMEAEVKEALAARGLETSSTLTGYLSDIAPLIFAADRLVLVSKVEGLPQVLVQAAALGTPFVAFDVDGVREMLDMGAEGAMVEFGDLRAMASVISAGPRDRLPRAPIDLMSWHPEEIASSYQRLVASIVGDGRPSRVQSGIVPTPGGSSPNS